MKLFVKLGAAVVAVSLLGAGGTFAAMHFLHLGSQKPAQKAVVLPPKPILFADLSGLVVSISPQTGQPPTSYVQFGIQFATTDPNALTSFDAVQPIIKSAIINLLLNETSAQLQDPTTRTTLTTSSLAIANSILLKNGYAAPAPFTAGYITDLVVQD
jgi:flagellar basal body-associated protein FliL